ncbi:hypothetical protein AGMMS49942_04220 [Spirochaetia bacterium]|nr:hypothetical protein AGMMS49942_04220 [Spirochaetia bacterium]
MIRKTAAAMTLLALLLILAAACGGNRGSGAAPAGRRQAPRPVSYSPGANDDRVLVANSAAESGPRAEVGIPVNAGLSAYLRMVNASGGIDGRRIIFTHNNDDQFDPVKGREALRNMVEDEGVFAIVAPFGTPVVVATVGDLKRYGIPAISPISGISELYATGAKTNGEGYNLFPVQPTFRTEGRMMVGYAAGVFKAKTIGIVYTDDIAGENMFRGIIEQAATLKQIRAVVRRLSTGIADTGNREALAALSAAVGDLKRENPDCIIIASLLYSLPAIIRELAAQALSKDCITSYANTSRSISDAVVQISGGDFHVYGLGWLDMQDTQALGLFDRWIDPAYASTSYAMYGWIAAHFFCEGLRRISGEDITWENYLAAMERSPIDIPFGGSCDFSGGNRWGTQEMNLLRAIPASPDFPTGWEEVSTMNNVNALLGWGW